MQEVLLKVREVAKEASAYIKSQRGRVQMSDIEEKEMNSLVSYVDKNAESLIVERLQEIIPTAGFITEEETPDHIGEDFIWVIDPLDGTTNFLMDVPHYCVSIGLRNNKDTVLGVVREVNTDQEFYALRGNGAFFGEIPISVSKFERLDKVLLATGFPYTNHYNIAEHLDVLHHILARTRGLRRMGSAALDLCYTAMGRFGAYYESRLNPWDVAAGALIVQEAGGIVTDYSGEDGFWSGKEILACAPQFHQELLKMVHTIRV